MEHLAVLRFADLNAPKCRSVSVTQSAGNGRNKMGICGPSIKGSIKGTEWVETARPWGFEPQTF